MQKPFKLPRHYGVAINAVTPRELFKKYLEIGFLYPAKLQVLQPFLDSIVENWQRMMANDHELFWVQTNEVQRPEAFASITLWRQSNRGLFSQHLVSNGKNPALSLQTMMAAQYKTEYQFEAHEMASSQNWFRPENRYAARILGSMVKRLGPKLATSIVHHYLHVPKSSESAVESGSFRMDEIRTHDQRLTAFVASRLGQVFVEAEEIDDDDLTLEGIAKVYAEAGLHRSRTILVVENSAERIVACAIANRAPFGLNFSLLENRCYFIVDQHLAELESRQVLSLLLSGLKKVYQDFPIDRVPVVTDQQTAQSLSLLGAEVIRQYTQTIWLREGFGLWHEHIASFLRRITR